MIKNFSYSELVAVLKEASAFDLFRLNCAIENEMNTPAKINAIKQYLHIGKEVGVFDSAENKLIKAKVNKLGRTLVHVTYIDTHARWRLPYYMVNIDSSDTTIAFNKEKSLSKNELSVGNVIGFRHQGRDHYGMVVKLNQKTVSLITTEKMRWRVGYAGLFSVIDSELENTFETDEYQQYIMEHRQ